MLSGLLLNHFQVRIDTDNSELKLTLFQFQTCPFCCKVRAVLDYYGFSYDLVEVNSVTKKQLKWSKYKKVPIVVVDGAEDTGFLVSLSITLFGDLLEIFCLLHAFLNIVAPLMTNTLKITAEWCTPVSSINECPCRIFRVRTVISHFPCYDFVRPAYTSFTDCGLTGKK